MNVTNFFDNQLQVILPELFVLLSVSTLLLIGVQYSHLSGMAISWWLNPLLGW